MNIKTLIKRPAITIAEDDRIGTAQEIMRRTGIQLLEDPAAPRAAVHRLDHRRTVVDHPAGLRDHEGPASRTARRSGLAPAEERDPGQAGRREDKPQDRFGSREAEHDSPRRLAVYAAAATSAKPC